MRADFLTQSATTAFNLTAQDNSSTNRGADKSLAQPGKKQTTATEDFDFHIPYL
jgi:hypothetical protein